LRKKRTIAKASIVILILIAIIAASILGISTLFRALRSESNPGISNSPTATDASNKYPDTNPEETRTPTPEPPENKTSIISMNSEGLIIQNPGDSFECSFLTNFNVLTIWINDRTTELFGNFAVNSKFFNSYDVSEEMNGILVTLESDMPFNFSETIEDDSLLIKFSDKKNLKVLEYRNDVDRHYMNIVDARLSNIADSEQKYYDETYDESKMLVKLILPAANLPKLEDEVVLLNDGYLKSYEIINENDNVLFNFYLEEELTIYPNTRTYDAAFTFVKERSAENLIVIDPGHGGIDGGTVSKGEVLIEKNVVLDISFMVEAYLEEMGYNVYNLREEDVFLGLKERTDIANLLGASSIVSIHVNAYTDTSVNGTMTMYKTSYDLADSIQTNLVSALGSTDIGLIYMEDRSILNGADMESVIVEIGFLTNVLEAEKLSTKDYRDKAARALAEGIDEFYKKGEEANE